MFSINSLTAAGSGQPETAPEEKPGKKKPSTDPWVPFPCLKVSEEETATEPTEKVQRVGQHPAASCDICRAKDRWPR